MFNSRNEVPRAWPPAPPQVPGNFWTIRKCLRSIPPQGFLLRSLPSRALRVRQGCWPAPRAHKSVPQAAPHSSNTPSGSRAHTPPEKVSGGSQPAVQKLPAPPSPAYRLAAPARSPDSPELLRAGGNDSKDVVSRTSTRQGVPKPPETVQGLRPLPIRICSRALRAPRLPRLPRGRRPPPAEPGGDPGRRREAAAMRGPRTAVRASVSPPRSPPRCSGWPRVPANLPRSGCSAHAQSPTSSLVRSGFGEPTRGPAQAHPGEPLTHRYLHPRRRPPPAPFLTKRPWSSFAWLPRRRLRSWHEVGAPGFQNRSAPAGLAPGGDPAGRVSLGAQEPLRPARAAGSRAEAAADPRPAPEATTRQPSGAGPLSMPSARRGCG